MSDNQTAVILCGYGGPTSLDEVEGFLASVMRRPPDPSHLSRAKERYRLIGGKSPLLDMTTKQADGIQAELEKMDVHVPVHIGMVHNYPRIADVLKMIKESGADRLLALSVSPQRSTSTSGLYLKEVDLAARSLGLDFSFVDDWGLDPRFASLYGTFIAEYMSKAPANPHLIFSAHSLPVKYIESGDPYFKDLKQEVEAILQALPSPSHHTIAFQSKGGPGEWLKPELETVMEEAAKRKEASVFVVPMSFVSDHVETLYDLDIVAKRRAEELGLAFHRSLCLNEHPPFLKLLADVIVENL